MKFRTEINVAPWERKIDHGTKIFSAGSCFAGAVAEKLCRYKFRIESNPTGVLYNPFSIADLLETHPLDDVGLVLITFGTAWVYEREGRVVANCEKLPASLFARRRLSVNEIVTRFSSLLENGSLRDKQVVFTLSPVRHFKDGFEENSLSKATLRVAIGELVEKFENALYFPAYEVLNDDLRDYRFYAADLAHPSQQAKNYVWEKFSGVAFSARTLELAEKIEALVRATEHRPFNADTQQHNEFRKAMLGQAEELQRVHPEIDLSTEIEFFNTPETL